MRHNVYGKRLSRDKNERTALFKGLVASLILSETIQTTQAKASAIKGLVDKLITQAKAPASKRFVTQFLTDEKISNRLINDLVPRMSERNSGYTSVVKVGRRLGDGAMLVRMSLMLGKTIKSEEKTVAVEKKEEASLDKVEATVKKVAAPKKKVAKKKVKA